MEIVRIVLPIAIVGGIALFVIIRMKHKYNQGTVGKKKTKTAQSILDSLIPLGMLFGCVMSIIFSIFFPISLLYAFSFGPGIGLLCGYFAYEIYSKQEDSYS
nr:hypothetical protein [Salipaludibacillus daqingensis]